MKTLTLMILSLLILSTTSAQAGISDDLTQDLPRYTSDAKFNQTSADGVINVKGAVVLREMYAKSIFLEIEVPNFSHSREVYIVNSSNESQRNNRNTKAEFISNPLTHSGWMSNGGNSTGNALIVYQGRGEGDSSRFLIRSFGVSPSAYITIYIKMNGVQYSTQVYVNGGF